MPEMIEREEPKRGSGRKMRRMSETPSFGGILSLSGIFPMMQCEIIGAVYDFYSV